jgi:hypothetical protein
MNAADRLWRGLGRRDWEAVRAQFHRSAIIERPASRERLTVDEFVAAHRDRAIRGGGEVEVLRAFTGDSTALVEAREGEARCAGLYDLHEGRIAGATEYWAG